MRRSRRRRGVRPAGSGAPSDAPCARDLGAGLEGWVADGEGHVGQVRAPVRLRGVLVIMGRAGRHHETGPELSAPSGRPAAMTGRAGTGGHAPGPALWIPKAR